MPDYKKMYVKLAQANDDAVHLIERGNELHRLAAEKLKLARQLAEELYQVAEDE